MKLHANARTCPNSRKLLVGRGAGRWRSEGDAGLLDRSSAPRRIPHRTPHATVEAIGPCGDCG